MRFKWAAFLVLLVLVFAGAKLLFAENGAYGEIVNIAGNVQLKRAGQADKPAEKGMMVQKGDTLIVAAGSSADVAFDQEWNNVSHLSENTRVVIRSLYPTKLDMVSGDIYSKLDKLPTGSTFEVKTPVAIAAVRGTKYRTVHQNGKTIVYNDSDKSQVFVYHLDEDGNRSGPPVVLEPGQSTEWEGEVEVYEPETETMSDSQEREAEDELKSETETTEDLIETSETSTTETFSEPT